MKTDFAICFEINVFLTLVTNDCGCQVEVKVTTKVLVENVEIGVADKDQSSAARTTK